MWYLVWVDRIYQRIEYGCRYIFSQQFTSQICPTMPKTTKTRWNMPKSPSINYWKLLQGILNFPWTLMISVFELNFFNLTNKSQPGNQISNSQRKTCTWKQGPNDWNLQKICQKEQSLSEMGKPPAKYTPSGDTCEEDWESTFIHHWFRYKVTVEKQFRTKYERSSKTENEPHASKLFKSYSDAG